MCVAAAIYYYFSGFVGNYKGLFCCVGVRFSGSACCVAVVGQLAVQRSYTPEMAVPIFVVFAVCLVSISVIYRQSFVDIRNSTRPFSLLSHNVWFWLSQFRSWLRLGVYKCLSILRVELALCLVLLQSSTSANSSHCRNYLHSCLERSISANSNSSRSHSQHVLRVRRCHTRPATALTRRPIGHTRRAPQLLSFALQAEYLKHRRKRRPALRFGALSLVFPHSWRAGGMARIHACDDL